MLQQIKQSHQGTLTDKTVRNVITNNDIDKLAVSRESRNNLDIYFSNKIESKRISSQRSSGRYWLFTGLNMFRTQAIAKYDMRDFQFPQNYSFFWDQSEKANLLLQDIIDTRLKPMDDRIAKWLSKNPIEDGGQFTGVSGTLAKYSVVPAEVMVEINSSNSTGHMSNLIGSELKEYGLQLRDLSVARSMTVTDPEKRKIEMLGTIYRMLILNLEELPTKFAWTRKDAKGSPVEAKEYTSQSFFREYIGGNLKNNCAMSMNDPSRDYYRLYEIDYDRHVYDGKNRTYVNLPIENIKQVTTASIKGNTMMYFSCDVGKSFNHDRGILGVNLYDYGLLMGATFGTDKEQRIQTFASGSSYAMILMAVDLDANGEPKKRTVENSWDPGADADHLIMTDQWFDEHMFCLVINEKCITD